MGRSAGSEQLLDLLYSAASGESTWENFLVPLAELMGADTAQFVLRDEKNQHYCVNATHRAPEDAQKVYADYYAAKDEWYLRAKGKVQPGFVGDGQIICPNDELVKTEFYNDFLRPFDYLHECAAVLEMSNTSMSLLTILSGHRRKPFEERQIELLRALVPHLQRALRLHRRMVDLQAKEYLEQWTLDRVPFGVILFVSGKVVIANALAIEICSGEGLALSGSGITAFRADENRTLQAMLRLAERAELGKAAGGVMMITRAGLPPVVLSISPLRKPSQGLHSGVAVFIIDPTAQRVGEEQLLRHGYGLTAAEARVAVLVGRGDSVEDVASEIGLTPGTIRSYLKNVFQKTGVRRQSQLARLVTQFPVGFGQPNK